MSYAGHVLELPVELQRPMLRIAESLERDMRDQLAVRREDILALRAEFIEAQRRSDERFARIEATLAELAEAQKRTEQRVEELAEAQKRTEQRVEELAEAQKRTEQRVAELAEAQKQAEARLTRVEVALAELAEAQKRTEQRVAELAIAQRQTDTRVGRLVGDNLERRYRERASAYFAQVVRRVRVVDVGAFAADIDQFLTEAEFDDLLALDLLLCGQVRGQPEGSEVWLACEISSVVDSNDVRRAAARAGLLRKAGLPALAVVAGEDATEWALELARADRVFVMQDGRRLYWHEALAAALAV
jgi:multidrug efflux pump subunit AcrA (membrane-fusion protein)